MKKKFFAVALATTMVAGSTFSAFAADVDESKVYEGGQVIDGSKNWNTVDGDNYLISDIPVTVQFSNEPFIRKDDKGLDQNWFNFVFETVASDAAKGVSLRADAYGWTYGDAEVTPTWTVETSWGDDWSTFQQMCIDNPEVSITATKTDASIVTFSIVWGKDVATETYTITYPDGVPSGLRFHVGSDGGKITVNSVTYKKDTIDDPSEEETTDKVDSPDTDDPVVDPTKPSQEQTTNKVDSPDTDDPAVDPTKPSQEETTDKVNSPDTTNPDVDSNDFDVTDADAADVQKEAVVTGLPENVTLRVASIGKNDDNYATIVKFVDEKLKGKKVAAADLSLMEGNAAYVKPLDGKVKVTLPLFENIKDAKWIQVYRYDNTAKDFIAVDKVVEVKDGKFTFETDHFTPYLFASVAEPETETTTAAPEPTTTGKTATDTGKKPNTGDSAPIVVFAGMAAAGLAVFAVSKKRKNA